MRVKAAMDRRAAPGRAERVQMARGARPCGVPKRSKPVGLRVEGAHYEFSGENSSATLRLSPRRVLPAPSLSALGDLPFQAQRIARGNGRNAVRAAAYRHREQMRDELTGERYAYTGHREELVHSEMALPDADAPVAAHAGGRAHARAGERGVVEQGAGGGHAGECDLCPRDRHRASD